MQTTSALAVALLIGVLPLSACHGRGGSGGSDGSAYGMLSGGDVQQDTTLRFGPLDTALLTNGSGWVRTKPGVMPPNMEPRQLQAPPPPLDSTQPDTAAPPVPDSLLRARRTDTLHRDRQPDTLRRSPPDTMRPDTSHPIPDSTGGQELLR